MDENTIGGRIRLLRLEGDEKQTDMADKIGMTKSAVGLWEQGRAFPGALAIAAICEEYNVSADWLLGLAPLDARQPVNWKRRRKA